MENSIKCNYPNVIFTKLNYYTFENDEKENSPEDMTDHETQSTSRSTECDVEMLTQEDNKDDSVQISENSYFCK